MMFIYHTASYRVKERILQDHYSSSSSRRDEEDKPNSELSATSRTLAMLDQNIVTVNATIGVAVTAVTRKRRAVELDEEEDNSTLQQGEYSQSKLKRKVDN